MFGQNYGMLFLQAGQAFGFFLPFSKARTKEKVGQRARLGALCFDIGDGKEGSLNRRPGQGRKPQGLAWTMMRVMCQMGS